MIALAIDTGAVERALELNPRAVMVSFGEQRPISSASSPRRPRTRWTEPENTGVLGHATTGEAHVQALTHQAAPGYRHDYENISYAVKNSSV